MQTCVLCQSDQSSKWVRYGSEGVVCNRCYIRERKAGLLPKRYCLDCGDECHGRALRCKECARLFALSEMRRRSRGRRKSPEQLLKIEESKFKSAYGITWADRDQILESQDGKCAICGLVLSTEFGDRSRKNKAQLDHCHDTGKVRGILCKRCNMGIGYLDHSITRLLASIKYLQDSCGCEDES